MSREEWFCILIAVVAVALALVIVHFVVSPIGFEPVYNHTKNVEECVAFNLNHTNESCWV